MILPPLTPMISPVLLLGLTPELLLLKYFKGASKAHAIGSESRRDGCDTSGSCRKDRLCRIG
jgi:hypothetical protein